MEEQEIKLIWDFKGPTAYKTAEHHTIHLKEYCAVKGNTQPILGFEQLHELHSIAFLVVYKSKMIEFRDALKPHRAVLYNE